MQQLCFSPPWPLNQCHARSAAITRRCRWLPLLIVLLQVSCEVCQGKRALHRFLPLAVPPRCCCVRDLRLEQRAACRGGRGGCGVASLMRKSRHPLAAAACSTQHPASRTGCAPPVSPVLCFRSVNASSSVQKPTPMPAASAAPREVVSRCAGRRTGTCRMSACICTGVGQVRGGCKSHPRA